MKHNEVCTELLVLGSSGMYVPTRFVMETTNLCDKNGDELTGTILDDIQICRNPHNILYWESWANILETVCVYKETHNGMSNEIYSLHHHNHLWSIKKDDLESLNESESVLFWEKLQN